MKKRCDYGVFKTCRDCGRSFVDDRWCGDLMCQRCLDMCWLVDDSEMIDRIFECCDLHRPFIGIHSLSDDHVNELYGASSAPITIKRSKSNDDILKKHENNITVSQSCPNPKQQYTFDDYILEDLNQKKPEPKPSITNFFKKLIFNEEDNVDLDMIATKFDEPIEVDEIIVKPPKKNFLNLIFKNN